MNGWPTALAFWRESTPAGAQTGAAWRPPGMVQVNWAPMVQTTFRTVDPLGTTKDDETVHQAWRVSMRREPKTSNFENFWLNAITDGINTTTSGGGGALNITETRELIDNVTMHTFGLEFILEDGSRRRFLGLAIARLEWTFEAGRLVVEEVEFVGLQCVTWSGSIRTHTALNLTYSYGSLQAGHFFKLGTTWTSGGTNFVPDKVTTISAQLIWSRSVSAAQFNAAGNATRHTVRGGWDFVGQTRVLVPTMWSSLFTAQTAKAAFRLGGTDTWIDIEALVKAKLSGHAAVAIGQIEHLIDFVTIRNGRLTFSTKKYR